MTYEETKEVVAAIQEIEAWSKSITRAYNSDNPDWEEVANMERWLAEAKEKVFSHCVTTRAELVS